MWAKSSFHIHPFIIELTNNSSIAIDFLDQKFANTADIGIAFAYFDHGRTVTPEDIIGSLVKHLVQRKTNLSNELADLYSQHAGMKTRPTYLELAKILETESSAFTKVFVVFDALDECPCTKILGELAKLPSVRVLLTGRPHVATVVVSSLGDGISEVRIR